MATEHYSRIPAEPGHRYRPRNIAARPAHSQSYGLDGFRRPIVAAARPVAQPKKPSVSRSTVPKVAPVLPRQRRSTVLKRQIVQNAKRAKREQRRQFKRQALSFAFGGLAASAVVAFMLTNHILPQTNSQLSAAKSATLGSTSAASAAAISEVSPSLGEINHHKAGLDKPRVVKIPKLQLFARVSPVDADLKGEPVVPSNIYDLGWFTKSHVPGADGVTLLNGQVAGSSKPGIFNRINELVVGDVIEVERGDGKSITYKVVKSQQYDADKVDMRAALQPGVAGKPGLNLLTCTGRYNVKTNQFEKRTLIFAVEQ